MKKLLERIHKRLRLPGRMALASLALLGMLSAPGALALGGLDPTGPSAGTSGTGSVITGGGVGEDSEGWENIFGWNVGSVTVTAPFQCIDCFCTFTGTAQLTETLVLMACEITNETEIIVSCPGTAACPEGGLGQLKVVTYECCVAVNGFPICVSSTLMTTACS